MNSNITMDPLMAVDPLMKELLEEDDALAPNGAADRSFHDIYKELTIHGDIILIIDAADENKLRKGLSAVKAKHMAKIKESGIKAEAQVLEFVVHPFNVDELNPGQLKIQVTLKGQQTVKVHKTIIAEGL